MPTYEYVCKACGHAFERFQPITDSPVKTCPKCKRKRVERKIGIGAGVLFKGGGFYETDYRSEGYTKAKEAEQKEASAAAKPEAKTDGKVEAKPGAKPDANPSAKPAPEAKPLTEPKAVAPKEPAKPSTKTDARAGRGVGNVLQLGKLARRGKTPRAKRTK